ncbi:hypothetical protein ZOSMA_167G00100 [Zostera marina]|uniref:Uncharacterized protein n=1 Tax=Zostera marina TaxID=29655 RepID=A0A0K9PVN7_ZOSMR|nr:hypothetical protein ZOSMA_167G00100 [Zostera marina]
MKVFSFAWLKERIFYSKILNRWFLVESKCSHPLSKKDNNVYHDALLRNAKFRRRSWIAITNIGSTSAQWKN